MVGGAWGAHSHEPPHVQLQLRREWMCVTHFSPAFSRGAGRFRSLLVGKGILFSGDTGTASTMMHIAQSDTIHSVGCYFVSV